MSQSLLLYTHDDSIESPYLSKAFLDEIIFEWYIKLSEILDGEELKVIAPNILGEITIGQKKEFKTKDQPKLFSKLAKAITGKINLNSINTIFDEFLVTSSKIEDRERDPAFLKSALEKVEIYLLENANELPLIHSLFDSESLENEVEKITIDGIEALVEGDLFYDTDYANIRNKIQIKSYYDDFEKINLKVEVASKLTIDNRIFYAKSITKAAYFKSDFEQCYAFLNQAISLNKKVLWEFG
jgi:hypothetical protein